MLPSLTGGESTEAAVDRTSSVERWRSVTLAHTWSTWRSQQQQSSIPGLLLPAPHSQHLLLPESGLGMDAARTTTAFPRSSWPTSHWVHPSSLGAFGDCTTRDRIQWAAREASLAWAASDPVTQLDTTLFTLAVADRAMELYASCFVERPNGNQAAGASLGSVPHELSALHHQLVGGCHRPVHQTSLCRGESEVPLFRVLHYVALRLMS